MTGGAAAELPVGYTDRSGRVHRDFDLRKMTGVEEEMLYDTALNPGQLVSALLGACVVRLGTLERIDRRLAAELYVADRNYLMLELRRRTLGAALPARYQCPACEARFGVSEDLAQIPVHRPDDGAGPGEATVELEDGHRDEQGRVHRRVVLGAPRGSDEEMVASMAADKPLRARDALVLRCIRKLGDLPNAALDGYGVEILRSLSLGDRRRITNALNALTFGPDFRRPVRCPRCANEFEALLDVSDFFADG